tara:strand:+ start:5916 stop:6830 length:915 start_codon:yes stop_codon:yes gene_type:complete
MAMRISRTRIDLDDKTLQKPVFKDYGETLMTGTGTTTLNLELGNTFEITMDGNLTFTFSNPPASGTAGNFTLILIQDGTGSRLVTWPASVDWAGGNAPTLTTTANAVDILTFITTDGGTTWLGFSAGADFKTLADTVFTPSVAGDYVGETGATTFGSGSVTWGASDDNLRSNAVVFPGNFTLEADISDFGNNFTFGVFPTSEDATFLGTDSDGRGDMDVMTNSWYFMDNSSGNQIIHVATSYATFTASSGDTFKIQRIGSELKAYVNDVLQHTWTQTSSAELRPCFGQANQKGDMTNMTWTYTP